MNNEDADGLSLLDTITEELENRGFARADTLRNYVVGTERPINSTSQQLHLDVFEVMLSLIHSATTLQEQIIHLHGMAQWLHDEADRFHAIGMGTLLIKGSDRLH